MDNTAQLNAAPTGIAVKFLKDGKRFSNEKLEKFIKTATQEEWDQAYIDHTHESDKDETTKVEFMSKYGFSWGSISDYADKIVTDYQKHRKTSNSKTSNIVAPITHSENTVSTFSVYGTTAKDVCHTRSIQLCNTASALLEAIENDYPQYNHKSIINQIILDGLALHGYKSTPEKSSDEN